MRSLVLALLMLLVGCTATAMTGGELFEITAYSHTGNRTASGAWPAPGMVACDRRYPFGTVFHIEGWGRVICMDRGSAITGNRLDIFMDRHGEAVRFGRQTRRVVVL